MDFLYAWLVPFLNLISYKDEWRFWKEIKSVSKSRWPTYKMVETSHRSNRKSLSYGYWIIRTFGSKRSSCFVRQKLADVLVCVRARKRTHSKSESSIYPWRFVIFTPRLFHPKHHLGIKSCSILIERMSDEPNDEIRSILLLMSSSTLSNLSKISNSFTQEQRNTALDSLFQGIGTTLSHIYESYGVRKSGWNHWKH